MTDIRLALVTLAYNNQDEVRKTLASIALQDVQPDQILVVDSSVSGVREGVEKLARHASADYLWTEPEGVYPAMNRALEEVAEDCFVWFINSSDWLAGPASVRLAKETLGEGDTWGVGGVHRLGDTKQPHHPIPADATEFSSLLRSGAIGFPHPSAVMSRKAIGELGVFDETFRIAADYDLALRFSENAGPPQIIPHMLSVHVPTGLTSRHKLRHAWEKSVARRKVLTSVGGVTEAANVVKMTLGHLGHLGHLGFRRRWKTSIAPFQDSPEFGDRFDSWPDGRG